MDLKSKLCLWMLIATALSSTTLADDPITQFISPFGALNLQNNGMFPTPENPNWSGATPPSVPPMSWDNWDGKDTSMDATCGDDYYDFRNCPTGPTLSLTVTVPWYRYAVCTTLWRQYLDYYVCLSSVPAYYTRTDDWGSPGKPSCFALPPPLMSVSATPEYWGGSPSSWECLPMTGDSTCSVPCRENGVVNGCYSFQGGFCGLTIYALRFDYCVRKKIGTISRRKHYLFSCDSDCGPVVSTNSVDEILQRMDPTLTLCREEQDVHFVTLKPELYGGMGKGYFKNAGSWLLFLPRKDTPIPALPLKSALPLTALATEVARFNPTSFEQMKTLLAHEAQVMTLELTRLSADPVYGVALPEDVVEDCFSLKFSYTGPNPEDCGSTNKNNGTKDNSGLIFNGSLVTCTSSGSPQMLLAWETDATKVGGLQLSSPNYELNGRLPTGPLPPKGTLVLTNVFVPGDLTVTLYGTNLATGQGVLKVLTLQPVNSGYVTITNGSAAAIANTNDFVTVNFSFDAISTATNSLPYSIRQNGRYVAGTVTAPGTGITLPYTTDEAGDVVLTVNVPCGNGVFGYQYTTNYYVPGAATPLVELYSFYPDPLNHRLITNDISASTVKYRIRNPAPEDQTANYRGVDRESGEVLFTGSFSDAYVDVTNNVRDTELQVWATSTNGMKSTSAYRKARILLETPTLALPPVLHNSYAGVITNQTQIRKALYGQLFSLTLAYPVDGLTNLYYPENGTIRIELDGNNIAPPGQPGFWTNVLSNFSVMNRWFQQGNLSDPLVLPEGFTIANTRFDVADLHVIQTTTNGMSNLSVSTVTTNAHLTLEQRRNGTNWEAIQTIPSNSAVFTYVNLGYETRLAGTKDRYNSTYYTLSRIPYLSVETDPCTGLLNVTVNPAVTNVSFASIVLNTNLPVSLNLSTDANGFIHLPRLDLPSGTYIVTATGYGPIMVSTNTVSGSVTYNLQLVSPSGASFIVGSNPTNGQPVYLLNVTGTTNPRIALVSENNSLQFDPAQPARVIRRSANEVEIDLQGITQTTEFTAPLVIATTPPCPNMIVQLGVVVRRGRPGFDIPVSDPKTGDCLQSKNGQISIWTGP